MRVCREFLDAFDGPDKAGKVTVAEFCNYCGDLSASINEDDYFELMIRNAWHISGGEGWCANSSCRRVLVTHTDGRQTVEDIKNDIGMSGDDKEAMKVTLIAQGSTDILSIHTKGSTDGPSPTTSPVAGATARATPAPAAGSVAGGATGGGSLQRPSTGSGGGGRRAPGGASTFVLG